MKSENEDDVLDGALALRRIARRREAKRLLVVEVMINLRLRMKDECRF